MDPARVHPSRINPTRVIGGRYVVLAELGRGVMGVVWRAEDRVMGRQVAVKELRLPLGLSPQERLLFRESLLREARNAGRLNDPGIVTVHDVVSDVGPDDAVRDHIVMELIEARTLAEVVASSGPLDDRSATAVAQQMIAALRVAHDAGVVHRDVKPSNVMLTSNGRVKLTDFGIAQTADDPGLTTTGALVGSPAYVAPERLDGGPATAASDLWALGATLFFAVQGAGPFARESKPATIAAVLDADVPATRVRGPLGTVIAGLLQRDPQARLSGMQAAALLALPGASRDSDLAGPGMGRIAIAGGRRRWAWVAAALVVGLVAGLGGGLALGRVERSTVTTLTYGDGGDMPVPGSTPTGTCLFVAPAPAAVIASGASIDCATPHLSEVFGNWETYGSDRDIAYPGAEQMRSFGSAACRLLFESDLIGGDDKSRLAVVALVPSEMAFRRNSAPAGSSPSFPDRDVRCVLHAADGSRLSGTRITAEPS